MRRLKGLIGPFVLSTTFCLPYLSSPALASPPAEPSVNGTMELPNARSIDPVVDEMFPRWPSVRIYLANENRKPDGEMRELAGWAQSLRGKPELQRLREINDRVNSLLAYDTDAKLWHETDYWESPGEALSRGAADCEGFAIFKMYLAKEAGIPLEQTAILVGTLGSAREPHAVLGAKVGPNVVTLDNKSGAVVTLGSRSDFTPLYSVGVRGAYTYPLNWGSGSDVETAQASDGSAARVVTASRQAADDGLTILRPAAASPAAPEPAEPSIKPLAIVPTAIAPVPAVEVAAVDMPPLPPMKPEPPHKAAYAMAEVEPVASPAPRKAMFGGGALDQVLSFVFQ
jgi:predicted transglutaminase-like cysteine proteinase